MIIDEAVYFATCISMFILGWGVGYSICILVSARCAVLKERREIAKMTQRMRKVDQASDQTLIEVVHDHVTVCKGCGKLRLYCVCKKVKVSKNGIK